NARVVLTAAKPFDPAGQEARNLAAMGITPPGDGPGGRHG
ncbi:VOC family protein, partial [Streptomyces diastaticus]